MSLSLLWGNGPATIGRQGHGAAIPRYGREAYRSMRRADYKRLWELGSRGQNLEKTEDR
ncbi:MAG: hypothetical protein LBD06_06050 [Candidatus Accumulibacter sp.]|nr:hypothetical protein [Accumulibacter sp.]